MFFLVVVVNIECTCSFFSISSEYRCIHLYFNGNRSQIADCLLNYFTLEFGWIIFVYSLAELGVVDILRENVLQCNGLYH